MKLGGFKIDDKTEMVETSVKARKGNFKKFPNTYLNRCLRVNIMTSNMLFGNF